jgi:hypothetical protein
MEMSIAEMATAQKAADLGSAVGIAVLKQAQKAEAAGALALLQTLPQAPSFGGIGGNLDISA